MGLAFLDEDQFDTVFLTPILQGLCDKLRAVVYAKTLRLPPPLNQLIELANDA